MRKATSLPAAFPAAATRMTSVNETYQGNRSTSVPISKLGIRSLTA